MSLTAWPDESMVSSWLPWCQSLPKVELHAHLNGCIRSSTLLELASLSKSGKVNLSDVEAVITKGDRTLAECFRLFDLIHVLTTDHSTITRITREVIEDFASENVVYLELRTTPKCNEAAGMSKLSYVKAVLAGIDSVDCVEVLTNLSKRGAKLSNSQGVESERRVIHVRLLLSIDRRDSAEAAMETVRLAHEMRPYGVVGVDFSGNPRVGNWQTFLPALTWARNNGLSITLHCGEVPNPEEVRSMLDFQPDRVGHICCLEEPEWNSLLQSSIPVEVCLTSNVRTESIPILYDHHFSTLYKARHPLILCTDDSGVFSTSLSREYALAAICFDLAKSDLLQLAREAVQHVFAEEESKVALEKIFNAAAIHNLQLS